MITPSDHESLDAMVRATGIELSRDEVQACIAGYTRIFEALEMLFSVPLTTGSGLHVQKHADSRTHGESPASRPQTRHLKH